MFESALTVLVVLSSLITVLLLSLPVRYGQNESSRNGNDKVSVQILVLGDIGRSPRMQFHAISIAKHGGRVDLIGYQDSPPHPQLVDNPLVTVTPLAPPPVFLQTLQRLGVPFLLVGPLKVLFQVYTVYVTLAYRTAPAKWLLVQNPPSIPTILISCITCLLRKTYLVIDWHNYGWTILAGTKGRNHPLVKVSKLYEEILGRYAPTANFTVTDAMTRQLSEKPYSFKTPIFTLHDRPADIFQPILDAEERLAFLKSLDITKDYVQSIREGKTKLLISSTSWTPDEDFSILLSALETYSKLYTETGLLPQLVAIITGKGPQKEMYLQRIKTLADSGKLEGVAILTAWLTTENYAKLLACADLGVCLHMSSSGVDLPMKVVDMFGAGLPVVGYGAYEAWPELVQEGVNGMGFETSSQLAGQLVKLFSSEGEELLETLREGARKEGERRWDDEWDDIAGRLFGLIEK